MKKFFLTNKLAFLTNADLKRRGQPPKLGMQAAGGHRNKSLPQVLPDSVVHNSKGWASFLSSARQVLQCSVFVQGTCRHVKTSDSSAPTCRALLQVDSIFVSFVRVRGAALPSFASRRCCLFAARPSGVVRRRC